MKVTIYDVAREAGLSIATVSRVINGKGGVTPKSERKIRDAIAKLGYLPDASAQGLASSLVNTIGLVLQGSVSSSYYIQFLDGAEHAARERGFDVLLTSPYGTPETFSKSIRTRHKVDGVLCWSTDIVGLATGSCLRGVWRLSERSIIPSFEPRLPEDCLL